MTQFKFLGKNLYRFSSECSYDNAKHILETLLSTNEWETTIFPKIYDHQFGYWNVVYINGREDSYHSVLSYHSNLPGRHYHNFLVTIDL
jgi:hypothetical protein